ncbi:MAG: hypothetical protein NZ990_14895 [Myxococcota bacterium]|nr:hypothetical protein [Myxococcota bacterium]
MGWSNRFAVALLAQALLLAPGGAGADGEKQLSQRQNCNRLTHQIDHFEGSILKMARERDDEAWEKSTEDHVQRLKARRANMCPKYAEEEKILARAKAQAEAMQKLLVSAAKGAAKYFSGGWY